MKPLSQTILSAAAATSAMTLFSYAVSESENENFREPELLAAFFEKTLDDHRSATRPLKWNALGWTAHYLVGTGFAAGYKTLLGLLKQKPTSVTGLTFGAAAGLIGILTWRTLFRNHPRPPRTHRKGFYAQLLIAHLIFGLTLSAFKNKKS